jgi:hypothetical protein
MGAYPLLRVRRREIGGKESWPISIKLNTGFVGEVLLHVLHSSHKFKSELSVIVALS